LDGEVYYNRKKTYSFNCMLTFDIDRSVRWAIVGWPGSVHDTTPWERGDVFQHPERYFDAGQYQTLDSAFSLTLQGLCPFRNPHAQLPHNKEFNEALCSQRVVSEHGNGILKNRWSSLKRLPIQINRTVDVSRACEWIIACCVLHNIVNQLNNPADDIEIEDDVPSEEERATKEAFDLIIHSQRSESTKATLWREAIQKQLLISRGWMHP
jgi:hypothetical protein